MDKEWSFIDTISVLSFLIGYENLRLNEQQIKELQSHLDKQDEHLTNQDTKLLAKIVAQNEEIIRLLKEIKNA